jgi:hypothetical protein
MKKSNSEGQLLSPDFNFDEFTVSQAAERFGYNNTPSEEVISNLKELCVHVLQPLRDLVKVPVVITSGYRSPSVNAVIGGYYHSQHLEGKAADFLITSLTLPECFNQVYKNLPFDQLIFEFGRWIHVSYNGNANRRQAMVSKKVEGKVLYTLVNKELVGEKL